MPRPYELMVLVNPELADDMLDAELAHLDGIFTSSGGEITFLKRDTPWGRRRLAYPIGKFRDATYLLYRFNAPPGAVRAIERELQLDERVIRYLFVRQETAEAPEEEQPAESEATSETETAAAAGAGPSAAATETEAPAAETQVGDESTTPAEPSPEPVSSTEPA